MKKTAFGIVKDRSDLVKDVGSYVASGGEIKELPSDPAKAKKLERIMRILHYPAQHSFYAKNTGLSIKRIRQLSKNTNDITEHELTVIWAFIESRSNRR